MKFSKKSTDGKYFMNIHDFKSFVSVYIDVRISQINKRSLFNVIDQNKDGYISEERFNDLFSITRDEIESSLKEPYEFRNGMLIDLVVEQIYHSLNYFKKSSLAEIQEKFDKNG